MNNYYRALPSKDILGKLKEDLKDINTRLNSPIGIGHKINILSERVDSQTRINDLEVQLAAAEIIVETIWGRHSCRVFKEIGAKENCPPNYKEDMQHNLVLRYYNKYYPQGAER